jgi:hypothetical protein
MLGEFVRSTLNGIEPLITIIHIHNNVLRNWQYYTEYSRIEYK